MDKLEKYIKSHRAEMDNREPRPDLWIDIANELSTDTRQKSMSKAFIWWRAAAVLFLFVTSLLIVERFISRSEQKVVVVNQQLQEAESFYMELISQKREEVMTLGSKYDLGDEFISDINTLDSMYMVLRKDLENGNEDNLVDAMILNLQLRIEILNKQLSIIQSIENSTNDKISDDETVRL